LGIRVSTRGALFLDGPALFLDGPKDEEVLIVADSSKGLLCVMDPHGSKPSVVVLASTAHDKEKPFMLTNDLVQLPNGTIYFTETSREFHRRRILYAFMSGRKTGRLLSYCPKSRRVSVVLDHLYIPNGIEVSIDGTALIFVSGVQVFKFDLRTAEVDPFVTLPGSGDNVRQNGKNYFFALGSKYAQPFALTHTLAS